VALFPCGFLIQLPYHALFLRGKHRCFLVTFAGLHYYKQLNMKIRFRFLATIFDLFLASALLGGVLTFVLPDIACAQQSIPKLDAETLKKITSEASALEALIVMATPQSIAQAQAQIRTSSYLSNPDKAALDVIASGVNLAVYGTKTARIEVPPGAQGANTKYITWLVGLIDALSGNIPQIFQNTSSATMSEFISSLAFFRASRNETREQALAAMARFEALGGTSVVPMLIRGQIALESKHYDEAAPQFRKALELDPQSQKAACGLARSLLALEKPEDAKDALDPIVARFGVGSEGAAAQSSLSAELKALYGMSLYSLNKVLDAEPWLASALKDDPTRVEVLVPLAAAAMQRRDYAAASRYLEGASKTASQDRTWLVLKSQFALENARQSDAERFARSAVRFFPKDPAAIAQLIRALQKADDQPRHVEAAELAHVVLDLTKEQNPNSIPIEQAQRTLAQTTALQFLVSESCRRQDWASAAKYLQQAGSAALDKEMVATILRKSGNMRAAVQFASSWYAQEPTSEQAVEAYLRSLAMAIGGGLASAAPVSDASTGLGIALSALGVHQGGNVNSAMLEMVVKFIAAPFSKELKSFLYYMSASLQNDENKAIDQLKNALVERADNVEALVSLASIYLNRYNRQSDKRDTINRDKALRYLTQAKALNPTDNELCARISELESKIKQ
jgi:tetratricopeptide (TPR) repeat protein